MILAILTGLGGVLWALYYLNRDGFDFAALNPFLWKRRAHWKQQYGKLPIFCLTAPIDVAAVLLLAVAKETGEISLEEKNTIKDLMISELKRSRKEADELFVLATHLLNEHGSIIGKVGDILQGCKATFSPEQIQSLGDLLTTVAHVAGDPSERQQTILSEFAGAFHAPSSSDNWA
jgi:hypothetical protein